MPEGSIQVLQVRTRRQREDFLKLPWLVYRGDPLWVPPLLAERKDFINPKKNPFFQHAEVVFFLAQKGGRVLGRIAAIVNHNHNAFHGDRAGFFGLFECIADWDVAKATLDRAAMWLRERGMEVMRGPMSFSTNEEVGLLVEGFQQSPMILMPYNPSYYIDFLERYGFRKAKDLYALVKNGSDVPERLSRIADKVSKRRQFRIRKLDIKDLSAEIRRFKAVYNAAWEKNWGFVPMTEAEIDHMASQLKHIMDPDFVLFVEVEDRIVGFSLALPDVNQALKKINGRLFPFGLFKLLYFTRKIDQVRVLILGVEENYRGMGIDVALYLECFKEGIRKGIHRGEFSWILEDNSAMMRPLEAIGAERYKTYRIYDLPLT
jgi:GNAT superfamily N-acetyltransferase